MLKRVLFLIICFVASAMSLPYPSFEESESLGNNSNCVVVLDLSNKFILTFAGIGAAFTILMLCKAISVVIEFAGEMLCSKFETEEKRGLLEKLPQL